MNTINILHLTDVHTRIDREAEITQRIDSLSRYIAEKDEKIDILAITGDITFSGKPEEFDLFQKIVIDKLRTALQIKKGRILVIPGNHDIDRDSIPLSEHINLREKLTTSSIDKTLSSNDKSWTRLQAYNSYYSKHFSDKGERFETTSFRNDLYFSKTIFNLKGFRIGFGLFNSAWLCQDDQDHSNLFLTKTQVRDITNSLEGCDLKVALSHHPVDWLNSSEKDLTIPDLQRDFPILLTGHLHKPVSLQTTTPTSNCLTLTGRALFEGKDAAQVQDGFHLYKLQLEYQKIETHFLKYIRLRNEFDKDTDHATDGKHLFSFHSKNPINIVSANLFTQLSQTSSVLEDEIRRELSALQDTEKPILVWPKIRSFSVKNGSRTTVKSSLSKDDFNSRYTILCGQNDSGKTILIKTLFLKEQDSKRKENHSIFLISSETIDWEDEDSILKSISTKLAISESELKNISLKIFIDGILKNSINNARHFHKLSIKHNWSFVISMPYAAINVIGTDPDFSKVLFAEILPWGPSRIREFAQRIFENTKVDYRIASKLVCEGMRSIDLPTTPSIVSLYLCLFPRLGESISSLTFLRLIEKLEQLKIGINEDGTIGSLYNRQKILQLIAKECLEKRETSLSSSEIYKVVDKYFSPKKLPVAPEAFIEKIVKSGILKQEDSTIGFSNFVFLDYYIALAFRDGMISTKDYTNSINSCTKIASALSLFAGLQRENVELARSIMKEIENSCESSSELSLKDLDAHISDLLMDENRDVQSAEEVAHENIEKEEDTEALDEEYHRQRANVAATRKVLIEKGADESMDSLTNQINALHSFYSVFRNLENIDGDSKVELLDRILDFHITTNFLLIDFYFQFSGEASFRNMAAYSLTWTGHNFMTSSLGNPTLCDSLIELEAKTKNDFKKLLIILLLGELGDKRTSKLCESFAETSDSRAGTEILFIHLRKLLIDYNHRDLPERILKAFKKVFTIRQSRFQKISKTEKINNDLNKTLIDIRMMHTRNWTDKKLLEERI